MKPVTFGFAAWPGESAEYDLLIAQCGYESRATNVATRLADAAKRVVALDYPSDTVLAHDANRLFFADIGEVIDPGDVRTTVSTLLEGIQSQPDTPRSIAVDISSCDRHRLGEIVHALVDQARRSTIVVDFIYSLGAFEQAQSQIDEPVMVNQALAGYEGWVTDPDRPLTCVLGIGFERQFALAALETLEPRQTIIFVGNGPDRRYRERVERDNATLLTSPSVPVIEYDVSLPLSTLRQLDSLVRASRNSQRVAIVPLGAKVFALAAILVGAMYPENVTIWRVSAGPTRTPQDRAATGECVGLRLRLAP